MGHLNGMENLAQPFYAEYINQFAQEKNYGDVIKQFQLKNKYLKDSDSHLLYHGWDACALVDTRELLWKLPNDKIRYIPR